MNRDDDDNQNQQQLIIGSSKNNNLVTITPLLHISRLSKRLDHESKEDILSKLSPLIANLPNALFSYETNGNQYYRIVVDGKLTDAKGVAGGLRGWVTDGKSKIKSHAVIFEAQELTNLINFTNAFNLLSSVVGQKHLSDINKKLDEILAVSNRINEFQKNSRYSEITYYTKELRDFASLIYKDGMSKSIMHSIIQGELKLGPIQEHLGHDIKCLISKIDNNKKFEEQDRIDINILLEQWGTCFETRVLACFLLGKSQDEIKPSQSKMHSLRQEWVKHGEILNQIDNIFCTPRLIIKKSFLSNLLIPSSARDSRRDDAIKHLEWKKKTMANARRGIELVDHYSHAQTGALTIELKDNKINAIYL